MRGKSRKERLLDLSEEMMFETKRQHDQNNTFAASQNSFRSSLAHHEKPLMSSDKSQHNQLSNIGQSWNALPESIRMIELGDTVSCMSMAMTGSLGERRTSKPACASWNPIHVSKSRTPELDSQYQYTVVHKIAVWYGIATPPKK
jgi:hypothetical protein